MLNMRIRITFVTFFIFKMLRFFNASDMVYSESWMVLIRGGVERAKTIAEEAQFIFVEEIMNLSDVYEFIYRNKFENERDYRVKASTALAKHTEVLWSEPVSVIKGISGSFLKPNDPPTELFCAGPENRSVFSYDAPMFNDPLFPHQWFLRSCNNLINHEPPLYDMGISAVWENYKLYGNGIKVVVVDDGLLTNHPDLKDNYDEDFGIDFVDKDFDPNPTSEKDVHGTRCAGIIAMKRHNKVCGVGIAPSVTLGAYRAYHNLDYTDLTQSKALMYRAKDVDIIVNAYNFDDGTQFPLLPTITEAAIQVGITEGRNKKGIIYVYSAGNGKKNHDVCACDPLVSNMFTIAVAGANHDGTVTDYSEKCAAIMATTYSGDGRNYKIVTTDVDEDKICFKDFSGTSASAPIMAGALALVLQANPDLTWRDIQYILAWTCEVAPLANNQGWFQNKAGFYVSHDFGFGLIQTERMVTAAKNFISIPEMRSCFIEYDKSEDILEFSRKNRQRIEIDTDCCKQTPFEIHYIEHVQLLVDVDYSVRGDVQIKLTSPMGTTAHILEPREKDIFTSIEGYIFDTVHMWGEFPQGVWSIDIFDETGSDTNKGTIKNIALVIHGIKEDPELYKHGQRKYKPFNLPPQKQIV